MLMLYFSLETIATIHVLCFVVSAVDEHALGVEPFWLGQFGYFLFTITNGLHL
jgi:hypothetical protein